MYSIMEAHEQRARRRPSLGERFSDSAIGGWLLNPYGDARYSMGGIMAPVFGVLAVLCYVFITRQLGAVFRTSVLSLGWWMTYGVLYGSAAAAMILGAFGFFSDKRIGALLGVLMALVGVLLAHIAEKPELRVADLRCSQESP